MDQTQRAPTTHFRVNKRLMADDRLKSLSHDALRMFLTAQHHMTLASRMDLTIHDYAMIDAGIPAQNIASAQWELKQADLINFRNGFRCSSYCPAEARPSTPGAR